VSARRRSLPDGTAALQSLLVITQVHSGVEGDVFFPAIDRELWRETAPEERAG
jgi:Dihydrofolate reductase